MRGRTLTFYLYEEEIALLDTISAIASPQINPEKMRSRSVGVGILAMADKLPIKNLSPEMKARLHKALTDCKVIYSTQNVHRIGNNGVKKVLDKARKVRA